MTNVTCVTGTGLQAKRVVPSEGNWWDPVDAMDDNSVEAIELNRYYSNLESEESDRDDDTLCSWVKDQTEWPPIDHTIQCEHPFCRATCEGKYRFVRWVMSLFVGKDRAHMVMTVYNEARHTCSPPVPSTINPRDDIASDSDVESDSSYDSSDD